MTRNVAFVPPSQAQRMLVGAAEAVDSWEGAPGTPLREWGRQVLEDTCARRLSSWKGRKGATGNPVSKNTPCWGKTKMVKRNASRQGTKNIWQASIDTSSILHRWCLFTPLLPLRFRLQDVGLLLNGEWWKLGPHCKVNGWELSLLFPLKLGAGRRM